MQLGVWYGADYYTVGRGARVDKIVLHWMAGTLASTDATFNGSGRQASAHYGIEGSTLHQYVDENDTAWHAGNWTVNSSSIGIEHSAEPGRDASQATINKSIEVCTYLCRKYGLGADAIMQHNQFSSSQCPGTLPVSVIRERVRANLAGVVAPTPVSTIPNAGSVDVSRTVGAYGANYRALGRLSSPVQGFFPSGSNVRLRGYVVGDTVNGNPNWGVGYYTSIRIWMGALTNSSVVGLRRLN